MKKIKIFCLCLSIIVSMLAPATISFASDEAKDSYFFDFNDFKGAANGKTAPAGFGLPSATAYVDDKTPYSGVFAKDLGAGNTCVNLRATKDGGVGFGMGLPKDMFAESIEMYTSFCLNDYNQRRFFGVYDCYHYGNSFMQIREKNGALYLLNKDTKYIVETGKWYDIKVFYNIDTKLAKAQLIQNGNVVASMTAYYDIYTNKVYGSDGNKPQYMTAIYVHHGSGYYQGKANLAPASSYWDNMGIREIDEVYYPICETDDFSEFVSSADGQTAPEGFSFVGGKVGQNTLTSYEAEGEKMLALSSSGSTSAGIEYKFPTSLGGKFCFDAEVTFADTNAKRSVGLGSENPILVFENDGRITVDGMEVGFYDENESIKVSVIADSVTKSARVKVTCESLNIDCEADISNVTVPYGAFGFYASGSDASSVSYLDNLGVYSVQKLNASPVSKLNVSGEIYPEYDLVVRFSNPLKDIPSVSIDGSALEGSVLLSDTELSIPTASVLDFDTEYALEITDIEDIFGNTLDKTLEIKTVPMWEISDISLDVKDGFAKADVSVKVNAATDFDAVLILTVYDENNTMTGAVCEKLYANESEAVASVSVEAPEGSYVESYLWDGLATMNTLGQKVSFGTQPDSFKDSDASSLKFETDPDASSVTIKGAGIGSAPVRLVVLKPGKTKDDFDADISNAAYIKEFDENSPSDGFAIHLPGANGSFSVMINDNSGCITTENAFKLYAKEIVDGVLALLNGDAPDWKAIICENADILALDISDLLLLEDEFDGFSAEMFSKRAELSDDSFDNVGEFTKSYYASLVPQCINRADGNDEVKSYFEKYADYINIENHDSYETFDGLKEALKDKVFAKIDTDFKCQSVKDVKDAFAESTVLVAIANVTNSVNVAKIIKDNNGWLDFDLSDYNKLKDPYKVNDEIAGETFDNVKDLEEAFDDAVKTAKKKENADKKPSSGGGGGGGYGSGVSITPSVPIINPTPTTDSSNLFNDLESVSWAEDAIEYLASKGIVNGRGDKTFAPNDLVTREEFVKMLVIALGIETESAKADFADVGENDWFAPYVGAAVRDKIVSGVGDGIFGAGSYITREDMAVMAGRSAGIASENSNSNFADDDDISAYAIEFVNAMNEKGIITGMGDGTFMPKGNATRAQAAVIIYRILMMGGSAA
ncbi:MAG: S-layer homology domain-containing protein [Clostridia bacterium]|nr:S-layer homology domain-containing protein [Clostridia bacterium]